MRGLPILVKQSLEKARSSALLAVEIYNKPAVEFKSGGYIVLMIIAWTALFHAIFFKKRRKPFYKYKNGRYVKVDGDHKRWELDTCLKAYYQSDTKNPVGKNLEFFIPLRNKLEHRHLPEIDSDIFGECQSMLLNFDEMIEKEFGARWCIRESLSFSLQLYPSSQSLVAAVKQNRESKPVVEFIRKHRGLITPDIMQSSKYSFKAFLIQVPNHQSKDALPVQFVHFDKLTPEQQEGLKPFITMIKQKEVSILNADTMKPGEVVKKVQEGLGNPKVMRNGKETNKFNLHTHALCWKKYGVRPDCKSKTPEQTNVKYCIYDKLNGNYGYTQAWVDLLIKKLKDERGFNPLSANQGTNGKTPS